MFTGIVEYVGTVRSVLRKGALVQFAIACGPVAEGVRLGDSIAINGTDLTITAIVGYRRCLPIAHLSNRFKHIALARIADIV